MKKRILSMFTALAMIIAMLPAAAAPASAAAAGTVHTVNDTVSFHNALARARDGDTIRLSDSFQVNFKGGLDSNNSLIIDKRLTIDGAGHDLSFRYAGILLGKDVTFQNVTLGLASNVRPAIMANGHTLTMNNVKRDPSNRNLNLFCGGMTGGRQHDEAQRIQGEHGQIIIQGSTYLGPTGRIFAGSISTDGSNNEFTKPATVTIAPSANGDSIGELYACGAIETYTDESDWFDYLNEINPPFPSPGNFKASGEVIFNLYQDKVKAVFGDTGVSGNLADVNYDGGTYLNDGLVLSQIGSLNVKSGNLVPSAGKLEQWDVNTRYQTAAIVVDNTVSWFAPNGPKSLTVASGATLGLQKLGNVAIGNFTGGGSLVLGQSQTLMVTGTVSGTTTVGVGTLFNGHSLMSPNLDNTYINAASSADDSFTLAAPASRPDYKLVRDGSGAWTVSGAANTTVLIENFELGPAITKVGETSVTLPMPVTFVDTGYSNPAIEFINDKLNPFQFSVDNATATRTDTGGVVEYEVNSWILYPADGDLQILHSGFVEGTYNIQVTIPADYIGAGQAITKSATLTVKEADNGDKVTVPVPTGRTLTYNGQKQVGVMAAGGYELSDHAATDIGDYHATASLMTGIGGDSIYVWADGTETDKSIPWFIVKADNPNPPPSLTADAPSVYGGSDGKITGTTADMEYSTGAGFTPCTGTEITGLAAGSYHVRYKGDNNYLAGTPVLVTVPDGPATVTGISISSTGHKTQYMVGDLLDVTGLTLTVTLSDGTTRSIPVAESWVSGFDSSAAATGQELTITYGGRGAITTTYTIDIAAETNPVTSIEVSSKNHKTQYIVGEDLDITGLTLAVHRQTGGPEEVKVLPGMVSGFNSDVIGTKDVTIEYHGITTTYQITVVAGAADPVKVTGVSLNKTALTLAVGGAETLTATVTPVDAGDKTVYWISSNPAAATVDGSGRVIAVGAGAAVITVTTADGGYTASCAVTVTANGGGTGGGTGGVWPGWDDWNNWNGGGTGGGATTTTETTRNPDSSTTTTVTNKTTGVVTQTTRWPDGRQEKTVTQANGSKLFDNKGADGTTASGAIAANGRVDGSAQVSGRAVADANGGPVELPLPNVPVAASSSAASTIKVELPNRAGADVAIPVSGSNPGAVAVLVNPDGTETVIKKSVLVDGRLWVPLAGDATVKIVDNAKGFIDMGGHWSSDAMAFVTSRALFEGNDNGRFLPNDTMTRAMLVTVLHRLEDIPASAGVRFDDVAVGQWYTAAVSWAAENQIVEGYNGSFTPNNSVTREQIAAILYRYAKVIGVDTPERGSFAGFPDSDRTSGWAREAMSWAVGAGLFSGDDRGRLNPGGNATRAEVATLLMRFVEYMAK